MSEILYLPTTTEATVQVIYMYQDTLNEGFTLMLLPWVLTQGRHSLAGSTPTFPAPRNPPDQVFRVCPGQVSPCLSNTSHMNHTLVLALPGASGAPIPHYCLPNLRR